MGPTDSVHLGCELNGPICLGPLINGSNMRSPSCICKRRLAHGFKLVLTLLINHVKEKKELNKRKVKNIFLKNCNLLRLKKIKYNL